MEKSRQKLLDYEQKHSCLIDDSSEDKKAKSTKKCLLKRKFKFESYKNCLESNRLENKINDLETNKIDIDHIKKNPKQLIRNNQSMLKTQQRFKSERHNVFTEEIKKIAFSLNDDKRMQSIDVIEAYAYETSKDLISDKEGINCKNIIKRYKK